MTLLSDPLFLAATVLAVTFLGLSKGGFIGLGITAVPLMALVVTPQQASAMLLPILYAQDVLTVWAYHRDYSAWNLKVLVPGIVVGVALATLAAGSLSPDVVRVAVGTIALLFLASRFAARWLEHHMPKANTVSGLVLGTMAGFASAIANAGSTPYQVHMLPQRLPKMTFVGTTAICFAITNLLKIPSYYAINQLTWDNLSVGVAMVPLALATNYLGMWLVRRVPMEQFYRIAYLLIFAIGLELLHSGISGLMPG